MSNQGQNATQNPEVMANITAIEKRLAESYILPPQVRQDLDIEIIHELKKLKPKITYYGIKKSKNSRTRVHIQRYCNPNSNGIMVRYAVEKKPAKKRTAV